MHPGTDKTGLVVRARSRRQVQTSAAGRATSRSPKGSRRVPVCSTTPATNGLEEAEAAGAITGYHFLRKEGGLRLRVAPDQEQSRRTMDRILDSLTAHGEISEWVRGVYEPEVYAFGGPAAIALGLGGTHRASESHSVAKPQVSSLH